MMSNSSYFVGVEVEVTDQFLEWWRGLTTGQQESLTDRGSFPCPSVGSHVDESEPHSERRPQPRQMSHREVTTDQSPTRSTF